MRMTSLTRSTLLLLCITEKLTDKSNLLLRGLDSAIDLSRNSRLLQQTWTILWCQLLQLSPSSLQRRVTRTSQLLEAVSCHLTVQVTKSTSMHSKLKTMIQLNQWLPKPQGSRSYRNSHSLSTQTCFIKLPLISWQLNLLKSESYLRRCHKRAVYPMKAKAKLDITTMVEMRMLFLWVQVVELYSKLSMDLMVIQRVCSSNSSSSSNSLCKFREQGAYHQTFNKRHQFKLIVPHLLEWTNRLRKGLQLPGHLQCQL